MQTRVRSSSGGSSSARIRPWASAETIVRRAFPNPTRDSAFMSEMCTSAPTTTLISGAPNSPWSSTFQPARASEAWRAAASPAKFAIVGLSRSHIHTLERDRTVRAARRAISPRVLLPPATSRGARSSDPRQRRASWRPARRARFRRLRIRNTVRRWTPRSRETRSRRAGTRRPGDRLARPELDRRDGRGGRSLEQWVRRVAAGHGMRRVGHGARSRPARLSRMDPEAVRCRGRSLGYAHFRIGSIHFAEGLADLAHRRIGAHRIDDIGHRVCGRYIAVGPGCRFLGGCSLERFQTAPNFLVRAPGAQVPEFFGLRTCHAVPDVENAGGWFLDRELVDADDDFLVRFGGSLVLIGGLGDFLLRVAALDGFHHASHLVELVEILESACLHVERGFLDEVRAAERIDRLRDAAFVGDDLLRAKRDAGRFLG